MYTRLLIPLDGSKLAEQVLPYARSFAQALKIPVELLEVIDPDVIASIFDAKRGLSVEVVLAEKKRTSTDYLSAIARSFDPVGVNCIVESGKPEEVVIERAAADSNTLIAMTTHGPSWIQRWLLGSVSEKVLRGATNHLLLVCASDKSGALREVVLKRVVVPLDGSGLAENVLPYVADLAKKMKLEVVLMRFIALPLSVNATGYWPDLGRLTDLFEAETRDYLAEKVKQLKEEGLENVSSIVKFGYDAGESIGLAHKGPDAFVAMCTHSRSGIKRRVLGSVTEKVVRHSGDPVLIVRAS